MGISNTKPIAPAPRKRKSLFPFTGLMRSVEYQGKGTCLAKNVVLRDGFLDKMKGGRRLFTRANTESYFWGAGFKNSLGQYLLMYLVESSLDSEYILELYNLSTGVTTYPVLAEANEVALTGTITFTNGSTAVSATGGGFLTEVAVGDSIYLDGEYANRMTVASITDDDNLVLSANYAGTGGAGNGKTATKHFTTTDLFFRQIGDEGYLHTGESSGNAFSFNGTTLTAYSNAPVSTRYLLLDGNRLASNEEFSSEISTTLTDWDSGTVVQTEGVYSAGFTANGGIETSQGVLIVGDMGAQLHQVIPNSASDDVSAQTKINSFSYTGAGIQNTKQICMGKNFAYIINKEGIIEMNPFSGEARNLVSQGNIERRWSGYDVTDAIIEYDGKHNRIICLVKDIGQYDTMIVVDLEDKNRAISVQPNSYLSYLLNINNQIYGLSSNNGNVYELFESSSDRDDNALTMDIVLEWDALEGISTENILKQILIHANLDARSSIRARLYINGSQEAIKDETFSGASTSQSSTRSVIAVSGFYVGGLGGRSFSAEDGNTDQTMKLKKSARVVTYTLRLTETSVYPCTIYDIIVEYKTRNRLSREKVMPNNLFT